MKKILLYISVFFLVVIFNINTVMAATSMTVNSTSVYSGNSITLKVTVSSVAAWNMRISVSGPIKLTSGDTSALVGDTGTGKNGNKTFTFIYKTTGVGTATFKLTGDTSNASAVTSNVSVTKSVTVKAARIKSTNNYLKSLSIDGVKLVPSFDKDESSYSVVLPAGTTSIKVNATKADTYASVKGTGKINVKEGNNTIKVIVTSESGNARTYIIDVTVKEYDPIEININESKYTVVRKSELLTKPDNYTNTTISIEENDVPAFVNDKTKLTLVGLKDVTGEIGLYIYNETDKSYTSYNENKSDNLNLYILSPTTQKKEFTLSEVMINNRKYPAYISSDTNYKIVYAMDVNDGQYDYYTYDDAKNTFQKYSPVAKEVSKWAFLDSKTNLYLILGIPSVTVVTLIVIIIVLIVRKKH